MNYQKQLQIKIYLLVIGLLILLTHDTQAQNLNRIQGTMERAGAPGLQLSST